MYTILFSEIFQYSPLIRFCRLQSQSYDYIWNIFILVWHGSKGAQNKGKREWHPSKFFFEGFCPPPRKNEQKETWLRKGNYSLSEDITLKSEDEKRRKMNDSFLYQWIMNVIEDEDIKGGTDELFLKWCISVTNISYGRWKCKCIHWMHDSCCASRIQSMCDSCNKCWMVRYRMIHSFSLWLIQWL